jgi:hypothetical protein
MGQSCTGWDLSRAEGSDGRSFDWWRRDVAGFVKMVMRQGHVAGQSTASTMV